jgi:hypothetical protein
LIYHSQYANYSREEGPVSSKISGREANIISHPEMLDTQLFISHFSLFSLLSFFVTISHAENHDLCLPAMWVPAGALARSLP